MESGQGQGGISSNRRETDLLVCDAAGKAIEGREAPPMARQLFSVPLRRVTWPQTSLGGRALANRGSGWVLWENRLCCTL